VPDSIEVAEAREHFSPRPPLVPSGLDQVLDLALEVEAKLLVDLAGHGFHICVPVHVQATRWSVIVHLVPGVCAVAATGPLDDRPRSLLYPNRLGKLVCDT
jgi:hypothetical protein